MNPYVTIDDARKGKINNWYIIAAYTQPEHGFIRNDGIFSLLWHCLSIGFLNLKTKQDLKIAQNLSTVSYEDVSDKTIDTECI